MMNPELQQYIKELKQSFRQMMDGAVAQSMRDKGLNYHLNWGATLPRLQEKAQEIKDSPMFNVYIVRPFHRIVEGECARV